MIPDIVDRLKQKLIDYDGTEIPDGAEPIDAINCGFIREIIDEILYLRDRESEIIYYV